MTEDFYFIRPKTGQRILIGPRRLPNPREKIFESPPSIGLVITTAGSVPYIELALAGGKILYPSLPVLVHDDASGQQDELAALCERYGAEFETNSTAMGHAMGDLAGLIGGLRWAQERQIDLLVRMTRRFIPLRDWTAHLAEVAMYTQFGTYGQEDAQHFLPIRTECLAMYVPDWTRPEILGEIEQYVLTSLVSVVVERYLYTYVGKVYEMNCRAAREWEAKHVRTAPKRMYCQWEFLETSRHTRSNNYIWHDTAAAATYASAARQLGLNYGPEDFERN